MHTDEELYRRYLAADQNAAAELVSRYGDNLTLYLNGYLKDINEAEDLMIEAFARLFARTRPIDGSGSFRAYLYKIARNLAIRHRQKRRLLFISVEELPFELQSEALAETNLNRSQRNQQLYEGLEELKQEYREALYLVYFEEMSYRETAQVLGKTEQQITNLVHRGKQSLKNILQKKGFTYANE